MKNAEPEIASLSAGVGLGQVVAGRARVEGLATDGSTGIIHQARKSSIWWTDPNAV